MKKLSKNSFITGKYLGFSRNNWFKTLKLSKHKMCSHNIVYIANTVEQYTIWYKDFKVHNCVNYIWNPKFASVFIVYNI